MSSSEVALQISAKSSCLLDPITYKYTDGQLDRREIDSLQSLEIELLLQDLVHSRITFASCSPVDSII